MGLCVLRIALEVAVMVIAVSSSDLPPSPWSAHVWEGKTYYYNHATGLSQWTLPESVTPLHKDTRALTRRRPPSRKKDSIPTSGKSHSSCPDEMETANVPIADNMTTHVDLTIADAEQDQTANFTNALATNIGDHTFIRHEKVDSKERHRYPETLDHLSADKFTNDSSTEVHDRTSFVTEKSDNNNNLSEKLFARRLEPEEKSIAPAEGKRDKGDLALRSLLAVAQHRIEEQATELATAYAEIAALGAQSSKKILPTAVNISSDSSSAATVVRHGRAKRRKLIRVFLAGLGLNEMITDYERKTLRWNASSFFKWIKLPFVSVFEDFSDAAEEHGGEYDSNITASQDTHNETVKLTDSSLPIDSNITLSIKDQPVTISTSLIALSVLAAKVALLEDEKAHCFQTLELRSLECNALANLVAALLGRLEEIDLTPPSALSITFTAGEERLVDDSSVTALKTALVLLIGKLSNIDAALTEKMSAIEVVQEAYDQLVKTCEHLVHRAEELTAKNAALIHQQQSMEAEISDLRNVTRIQLETQVAPSAAHGGNFISRAISSLKAAFSRLFRRLGGIFRGFRGT